MLRNISYVINRINFAQRAVFTSGLDTKYIFSYLEFECIPTVYNINTGTNSHMKHNSMMK